MLKFVFALLIMAVPAGAAEFRFDFGRYPLGRCPTNFLSVVNGPGKPGDWKIANEPLPPLREAFSPQAPQTDIMPVLAQTAPDTAADHFPILLYDNEIYADFTLSTRFRMISGSTAQTAGVVFRAADEKNFYAVCASSLENRVFFFKVVGNTRGAPIGGSLKLAAGAWHSMKITCKGTEIRCEVDGQTFPPLNDSSFTGGKVGFLTQADTVGQFAESRIEYVPIIPFAKKLLDQTVKAYPRLIALEIYARKGSEPVRLVASSKSVDMGLPGGKIETDTIEKAAVYFLRKEKSVEVTVPLRDRNGEIAAALRVEMLTFMGETQDNAVLRAKSIRKYMESQLGAVVDLAD